MKSLASLGAAMDADGSLLYLPVSGLFADLDAGCGSVALTDEVSRMPPLARQCMIRDWIQSLKIEADRALVEMFREFAAGLTTLSIVEQIERFKGSCRDRGVICPSDFAVLLQRF